MDVRVVRAEEFGEACLAALLEAVAGHDEPVVGLPTGNTPVGLYRTLAKAVENGRADVSQWRPFAIDEYGGPRSHACSNRAFFERHWSAIPGARTVEQFDPESPDLGLEVARFNESLGATGGLTVSLLGIGMNGHLAFNEPGGEVDSATRKVELHPASRDSARGCWGDATPTWGLTLGMRELLWADQVIVMANGTAKAEIVAQAIDGPETSECPASLVRRASGAVWVIDEGAGARVRR